MKSSPQKLSYIFSPDKQPLERRKKNQIVVGLDIYAIFWPFVVSFLLPFFKSQCVYSLLIILYHFVFLCRSTREEEQEQEPRASGGHPAPVPDPDAWSPTLKPASPSHGWHAHDRTTTPRTPSSTHTRYVHQMILCVRCLHFIMWIGILFQWWQTPNTWIPTFMGDMPIIGQTPRVPPPALASGLYTWWFLVFGVNILRCP